MAGAGTGNAGPRLPRESPGCPEAVPLVFSHSGMGRGWILFGTDSGFEGRTGIYFTRMTASFTPI